MPYRQALGDHLAEANGLTMARPHCELKINLDTEKA